MFYCRRDLRERLTLHEFGWHMLEHAGDYERSEWEPARSGRRFECGSPNMLGAMALDASLSLLEEIGMPQVASELAERIDWLRQGLKGIDGIELLSPELPERRSGIVTFRLDSGSNQTLFEQLKAEQIVCALRGGGVRFSPHFYTEARIIDETLAVVARLARN